MPSPLRQFVRTAAVCALTLSLASSPALSAQVHVVSPAELHKEAVAAARARQNNLQKVTEFLSSPRAETALHAVRMDPERVKSAMATLSDQELAALALRSEKAQADFAAGALTDRDLLIILVGIAALILIIVAVR
jgi:hypothetical protein